MLEWSSEEVFESRNRFVLSRFSYAGVLLADI